MSYYAESPYEFYGPWDCDRCGDAIHDEGDIHEVGTDRICPDCKALALQDELDELAALADNAEQDRLYQAEKVAA